MPDSSSSPPKEALSAILLDSSGGVLHMLPVRQGGQEEISVPARSIFKEALARDCSGIILLHSHPSGDVRPSEADIRTTRRLCRTASALHLEVVDHLILSETDCFSFREAGLL
jgi:DNA repair protein RadC